MSIRSTLNYTEELMTGTQESGRDYTVLTVGVTSWAAFTWWAVQQMKPLAIKAALLGTSTGKTVRSTFESPAAEGLVLLGLLFTLYFIVVHLSVPSRGADAPQPAE